MPAELTTPGTGHSQLAVDSSGFVVSLNGATLDVVLGFTPAPGDNFFIIRNETGNPIGQTFAGLGQGDPVVIGDTTLYISYTGNYLTDSTLGGDDVVLYQPVPEPAHILLLTAASAGLIGWVRRRNRRDV